MSPASHPPEFIPPVDQGRYVVRDFAGMLVVSGGLILSKLAFREGVPVPLDWGNHAGNAVMTNFIVGYGWVCARTLKLFSRDKSPESYRSFMKRGWMAAAALSLAVNVGVEYAPLEYRQQYNEELTTTDPVDVAYGTGWGLAISALMTARMRRSIRALEEKGDSPHSSRALPRPPQHVHRPNVNTGAKKAQRKMQQQSRRKNR